LKKLVLVKKKRGKGRVKKAGIMMTSEGQCTHTLQKDKFLFFALLFSFKRLIHKIKSKKFKVQTYVAWGRLAVSSVSSI
jgi:hypothetical protein